MKAPRLDARAAGDFLLRHAEKIVVAVVGLLSLVIAWWGIDAVRSLSVTPALTPEAVTEAANRASAHIDRDAAPPADLLAPREPLADLVDPWRSPLVPWLAGNAAPLTVAPPSVAMALDRPLFAEAAKRTAPAVLPIEDLRAVAGIAVLPGARPPAGRQRNAGRRPAGGADPLGGDAAGAPQADDEAARGRIVPFVVVTGLIPAQKQQDEYRQRFEECSFRDPKRDSPLWCDYEIDRGTVGPDGKETWVPIDLAAVARRLEQGPIKPAAGAARSEFELSAAEELLDPLTTQIPFCSPLPPRIDDGWNMADVHPWVAERMAAKAAGADKPEQPGPQAQPAVGPGFEGAEERPATPAAAAPPKVTAPEYRLFRFFDTDVQPGATYRYRVRLKVWNPNYSKDPEDMRPHVADPALARDKKLGSPDSRPSTAATVPDTTQILVAVLRPEELKDLKIRPGSSTLEILVLGPSEEKGDFALRAIVADPGVLIDVNEKYNLKNQRDRARGEPIATGRLLVDARGRQEERRSGDKGRAGGMIPEPLEVLCLRPDGSFEVASTADSEEKIAKYRETLPPRSTKAELRPAAPADGPGSAPAIDPLARPGARP